MGDPNAIGKGMIWVGSLLALGLLTLLFDGFLEGQRNPNGRVQGEMRGGMAEVVLEANRANHYVATAEINGQPVEVLVDTGATQIAVSEGLADRLGLAYGARFQVSTANGTTYAYGTRLDSVRLGSIELADVAATIVPRMSDPDVLLGMNFLSQLEMNQKDGTLILRQAR